MIGAVIDGRYQLLAQIGSGGEARVFRAHDKRTGEEVAVRLALQRDMRLPARPSECAHERWVRLLSAGQDDALGAYQIFELLDGQTLAEIVRAAPLTPKEWREFVEQSISAVRALHAFQFVHADLNADNFLRTRDGWKLLELPFHHFTASSARSNAFGSIYTLAPEQINAVPATVRSDIYSLGCLYYYGASGHWPHEGRNAQEVAISCLMHAPPGLRELAPALPAVDADWVMWLIAPQADKRPGSLAEARSKLVDEVA